MTNVKLTIANVKYAAFASQETPCFTATVYVDGKRIGEVENDGHGGPDNLHIDIKSGWTHHTLDAAIKASYPMVEPSFEGMEPYAPDAESVIGDLLMDYLRDRDIARAVKKGQKGWVGLVDGKLLVWKAKPGADEVKVRLQIKAKHPDVHFTRDMTFEQAKQVYIDCGAITL